MLARWLLLGPIKVMVSVARNYLPHNHDGILWRRWRRIFRRRSCSNHFCDDVAPRELLGARMMHFGQVSQGSFADVQSYCPADHSLAVQFLHRLGRVSEASDRRVLIACPEIHCRCSLEARAHLD